MQVESEKVPREKSSCLVRTWNPLVSHVYDSCQSTKPVTDGFNLEIIGVLGDYIYVLNAL